MEIGDACSKDCDVVADVEERVGDIFMSADSLATTWQQQ